MSVPTMTRPPEQVAAAGRHASSRTAPPVPAARDAWPHTTRLMPWLIALFMAMLWLVPFHAIELKVSMPFDLYLDRLVLPVIVFGWVLALTAGGAAAPRLRMSPVHFALGMFVAVAMLSVVMRAPELNQALLFDQSLKRLILLLAYAAMFLVVASTVSASEVGAYLKYMLGLAVVCALGILWEYASGFNLFYEAAGVVLGGVFDVPTIDTSGYDETGRRLTIGPAELGLETVGMLVMALPIAVTGVLHARGRREGALYCLAICVIVAASFCTYRKSALVAPIVVLAAFVWLRPRQMMKMAPLGLVLIAMVPVLAPGAADGILSQLSSSRLMTDSTTTHRTSGYDAVRPLAWDNPALGQGYGSYDAYANHILDSQILTAIIETGVLGATAFIAMILSVFLVARRWARDPRDGRAPPALVGATAAAGFLCLTFLYDTMVFPHVPYIFLFLAALVAVLWADGRDGRYGRLIGLPVSSQTLPDQVGRPSKDPSPNS